MATRRERATSVPRLILVVTFGVIFAAAFASLVTASVSATGDIVLVTRADGADGARAVREERDPSFYEQFDTMIPADGLSADGRYATFTSSSDNLSSLDRNDHWNVYRRDLVLGRTVLVSRKTGIGSASNKTSTAVGISNDGRYVFFASAASNLSSAADGNHQQLYRRDMQTGSLILVSRATGAAGKASNCSVVGRSVSGDGRYVAFDSGATNLGGGAGVGFCRLSETGGGQHTPAVYLRDIDNATTELVSRVDGPNGGVPHFPDSMVDGRGNRAPQAASFAGGASDNGRYVVFSTPGIDVAPGDENNPAKGRYGTDIFRRDRSTGKTILVSRGPGLNGVSGNAASGSSVVSPSGNCVLFTSLATNFSPARQNKADYSSLYVRDISAGKTILVSRANGFDGAGSNRNSFLGEWSKDGRYVVFKSYATNLSDADDDRYSNIFVRDLREGRTILVSRGAGGSALSTSATTAAISANGRFAAVTTEEDSNITATTPNQGGYRVELPPPALPRKGGGDPLVKVVPRNC